MKKKRRKKHNCEISHIDRVRLDLTVYIERQNIFLSMYAAQNVQGDLG